MPVQVFALALRNLSRHRRRTAVCVGAIAFGVIALVIAGGFAEWMIWAERESTIHSRLGHLQIVRHGYYRHGIADPYAFLIVDRDVDLRRIASIPHVTTITPRLAFSGLISKAETTVSFLGEGVAPLTEAAVSREVIVHAGRPLDAGDPDGIILGEGLAASLGAEPGATVVLLATTRNGGVSAVEVRVRGVFHTAVKAFDDVALRIPIETARKLIKAEGSHQLVVLLDETERTQAVLEQLRAVVDGEHGGLQVIPWIDLADFYKAVVQLFSSQTGFVRAVIALIIIMSISTALMTSVRERTGEIGTMMALGSRRRDVLQLFVCEGLLMGLAGGTIGVVLGYALAEAISAVGIPMPPAPGMDHGFDAAIRVSRALAIDGFFLALTASVLAGLYPARKASRLPIVDALRRAS